MRKRRSRVLYDRRFYRRKYNAEQAIMHFAGFVRQETNLEQIRAELIHTVMETMQSESASLWIKS